MQWLASLLCCYMYFFSLCGKLLIQTRHSKQFSCHLLAVFEGKTSNSDDYKHGESINWFLSKSITWALTIRKRHEFLVQASACKHCRSFLRCPNRPRSSWSLCTRSPCWTSSSSTRVCTNTASLSAPCCVCVSSCSRCEPTCSAAGRPSPRTSDEGTVGRWWWWNLLQECFKRSFI